jgi:large conductance mechanosensitive channel
MGLIKEFREFAVKGNMLDMAVGIIIGVAFGKIVSSLVADVIMPVLGLFVGGFDFSNLAIVLSTALGEEKALMLRYGMFLQAIFDFIIIAIALFVVIKAMNRLKRKAEAPSAPAEPPADVKLLGEIRDLLKAGR